MRKAMGELVNEWYLIVKRFQHQHLTSLHAANIPGDPSKKALTSSVTYMLHERDMRILVSRDVLQEIKNGYHDPASLGAVTYDHDERIWYVFGVKVLFSGCDETEQFVPVALKMWDVC